MKRILSLVCALIMIFALSACAGTNDLPGSNNVASGITVVNNAGAAIYGVFISPSSSTSWGENLLDNRIIGDDQEMTFEMGGFSEGPYDVGVSDFQDHEWAFYGLDLQEGCVIRINGDFSSNLSMSLETNKNSITFTGQFLSGENENNSVQPEVVPAETQPAPVVDTYLAQNPSDMRIGEICSAGGFEIGLLFARTYNSVHTAVFDYTEDVPDGYEVATCIFEVHNPFGGTSMFNKEGITAYADGLQAPEPDTWYLVSCDGVDELQSYEIDGGRWAYVVTVFQVPIGWSEMSFFYNNCKWTITPEDISGNEFEVGSSLYGERTVSVNSMEPGTLCYSGNYNLTYDGFEIYTDSGYWETTNYAVFEFTIENTQATELDYSLVGFNMRGYEDGILLDNADYSLGTINGYTNIFDIETIQAGMSARVFVAFPLMYSNAESFECYYDTGYIVNELITSVAHVS